MEWHTFHAINCWRIEDRERSCVVHLGMVGVRMRTSRQGCASPVERDVIVVIVLFYGGTGDVGDIIQKRREITTQGNLWLSQ